MPSTFQMTQNSTSHSHATSPAQVGGAPRPGGAWAGRVGRTVWFVPVLWRLGRAVDGLVGLLGVTVRLGQGVGLAGA